LTEMHAEPAQVRFVIVGIGLNVNQEKFPAELATSATSLRVASGHTQSRLELLVRLLREFERDYNEFLSDGPASVIGAIHARFKLCARETRASEQTARTLLREQPRASARKDYCK